MTSSQRRVLRGVGDVTWFNVASFAPDLKYLECLPFPGFESESKKKRKRLLYYAVPSSAAAAAVAGMT